MGNIHSDYLQVHKNTAFEGLSYIFFLCKYCFERNFKIMGKRIFKYKTIIEVVKSTEQECNICKNLFDKTLQPIINEINNSDLVKDGKRKSIDIGTSLPFQLFEREDYLRSLFKIKGFPNIKYHYNILIKRLIINNINYCIDHLNPDLRLEIFIDNDLGFKIKYKTSDIVLLGRYNKFQRGWTQRIKSGKEDNNTLIGINNSDSQLEINYTIEDIILNFLYSELRSDDIKISWLGSEDKNSLVLGNGRPFIVRISNPHNNLIKKEFELQNRLFIKFQEVRSNDPNLYSKYKVKIKIYAKVLEGKLEYGDLENSVPNLVGVITFKTRKKMIKKNIYSSNFRLLDKENFELDLVMDNGIPIKQLVGGKDLINPCLSNLIKRKCECIFFDIYDTNFNTI